ncbi:hypothetical protein QYZ88_016310 [Lachnospiraceae bacterium C1.1]|nr:hypothetical protein [Lachnospiraceae bacterium C1.1]
MRNRFIRSIIFVFILIIQIALIQKILVPRWNYPQHTDNLTFSLEEYKSIPKGVVDICMLGTSHILVAASPIYMYKSKGVVAYNLASSSQTIEGSYYLTKYIFKHQQPKVILLDASSFFYSDNYKNGSVPDRKIIDIDAFNLDKIDLVDKYIFRLTDTIDDDKNIDDYKLKLWIGSIFPIYNYHSRWCDLMMSDFNFSSKYYFEEGGLTVTDIVSAANCDLSLNNKIAEQLFSEKKKYTKEYIDGEYFENDSYENSYNTTISNRTKEYIKKIDEECDKNGCQLIIVKIPSIKNPTTYQGSWTQIKNAQVTKLVEEIEIPFIDMLYDYELDIDWKYESYDNGGHLNYLGQKKASDAIIDYLITNYKIDRKKCSYYDKKINLYEKALPVIKLQTSVSLNDYIANLKTELSHCAVFMEAEDDMKSGLNSEDIHMLNSLGLMSDFNSMNINDSFIAYINRGIVEYEAISNKELEYETELEKQPVTITSKGYYYGSLGQVYITSRGGKTYHGARGLNILVYDYDTHQIIDQVRFDTYEKDHTAIHTDSYNLYKKYEDKIINE